MSAFDFSRIRKPIRQTIDIPIQKQNHQPYPNHYQSPTTNFCFFRFVLVLLVIFGSHFLFSYLKLGILKLVARMQQSEKCGTFDLLKTEKPAKLNHQPNHFLFPAITS